MTTAEVCIVLSRTYVASLRATTITIQKRNYAKKSAIFLCVGIYGRHIFVHELIHSLFRPSDVAGKFSDVGYTKPCDTNMYTQSIKQL